MEIRRSLDSGGAPLLLKHYDGVNFSANTPGDVKDHVISVRNLEYKPGDILIGTYPKSGTHWANEIIHMLTTESTDYVNGHANMLDFYPVAEIDTIPSPRILSTHYYPRHVPKSFFQNKVKVIYLYRNPKDVAVSYFSFLKRLKISGQERYTGKWEHFVDKFLFKDIPINTWFAHVKTWMKFMSDHPNYPILMMSYEEMKTNLRGSVQKIAEHLGTRCDSDFLEHVTERCQFRSMANYKQIHVPDEIKALSNDGSHLFYRKGVVGDWKNWFTVKDNEIFDMEYEKQMRDVDLNVQFTL